MKKSLKGNNGDKRKTPKQRPTPSEIKKILNESLAEHLSTVCRKTESEINAANITLEEFLKTFMVIGYTFDGEPTLIVNAKTQLDADALSTAFTKFFVNNIQNG